MKLNYLNGALHGFGFKRLAINVMVLKFVIENKSALLLVITRPLELRLLNCLTSRCKVNKTIFISCPIKVAHAYVSLSVLFNSFKIY